MNLLESKVIETEFEKEIFIDKISNINLRVSLYPERNFPFFELIVGLEFIRIRDNEFYGYNDNYFRLRITEDLESFFVFETDQQSIFGIKNGQEKEATIELIHYILTESTNFKKLINTMIKNLKLANVVCEEEIKETKAKLMVLEKLLKIHFEDVKFLINKENIA